MAQRVDNEPEKRVRGRSRRLLSPGAIILISAVLIAVSLVIFTLSETVDQPTTQLTVSMRGMGQEYVNIWLEPDTPSMQGTTITAQMANLGGMPIRASSVDFRLSRRVDDLVLMETGIPLKISTRNMAERGKFMAQLKFPEPGNWWIDVTVRMGGEQGTVRLPVIVAQ